MKLKLSVHKGENVGHPFRGNQWTEGMIGASKARVPAGYTDAQAFAYASFILRHKPGDQMPANVGGIDDEIGSVMRSDESLGSWAAETIDAVTIDRMLADPSNVLVEADRKSLEDIAAFNSDYKNHFPAFGQGYKIKLEGMPKSVNQDIISEWGITSPHQIRPANLEAVGWWEMEGDNFVIHIAKNAADYGITTRQVFWHEFGHTLPDNIIDHYVGDASFATRGDRMDMFANIMVGVVKEHSSMKLIISHKGEPIGHPFRGNQWTNGQGGISGDGVYIDSAGTEIYKIKSGDNLPDDLANKIRSSGNMVRVIYNASSNTWHISTKDIIVSNHGDFIVEALDGFTPENTEEIQLRGAYDIESNGLLMYDFINTVEGFYDNPMDVKKLQRKVKKVQSDAWHNLFYMDGKKASIEYEDFEEIAGWKESEDNTNKMKLIISHKGEPIGHPFRGNQWTDTAGGFKLIPKEYSKVAQTYLERMGLKPDDVENMILVDSVKAIEQDAGEKVEGGKDTVSGSIFVNPKNAGEQIDGFMTKGKNGKYYIAFPPETWKYWVKNPNSYPGIPKVFVHELAHFIHDTNRAKLDPKITSMMPKHSKQNPMEYWAGVMEVASYGTKKQKATLASAWGYTNISDLWK